MLQSALSPLIFNDFYKLESLTTLFYSILRVGRFRVSFVENLSLHFKESDSGDDEEEKCFECRDSEKEHVHDVSLLGLKKRTQSEHLHGILCVLTSI